MDWSRCASETLLELMPGNDQATWLPASLRHRLKVLAVPAYRAAWQERRRLSSLPKYASGSTRFLNHIIEFVDAPSVLELQDQLFERQIYRFAAPTDSPRIIDGGANVGLSVLYFKTLYPKSHVVAFEADPAIFAVLERNCRSCQLANVQLVNAALWAAGGVVPFLQEGGLSGRVTGEAGAPGVVTVPTCRLRDYLRESVDLLKLDIEGAETDVLLDCDGALENVNNIVVEHHSVRDKRQTLHVVVDLLQRAGFRLYLEPAVANQQPLFRRRHVYDWDVQMNVFGFRT